MPPLKYASYLNCFLFRKAIFYTPGVDLIVDDFYGYFTDYERYSRALLFLTLNKKHTESAHFRRA